MHLCVHTRARTHIQLDPASLDTVGEFDAGGQLRRGIMVASGLGPAVDAGLGLGGEAFTAHPRVSGDRLVRRRRRRRQRK